MTTMILQIPFESTVYTEREGYKAQYWKYGNAVLLGQGSGSSDVKDMVILADDVHKVSYQINTNGRYVANS